MVKPTGRRRHVLAVGLLALAVQLAATVPVYAQGQGQGPSQRPIQASVVQDMEFGSFVAITSTGTVTLFPSGQSPLYSGVFSTGGVVSVAQFDISGEKLQPFTIILPSAPILIPGPSGDMVIDNFVSVPAAGANGTFNAQGQATVTVGATMTMTDQLAAGPYASTFSLTVSY